MEIDIEFPQVTNRETFSVQLNINDDDTGEPIDLSPFTYSTLELRRYRQAQIGGSDYGYSETYDYGSYGQSPLITLNIGSGLTIIDLGILQIDIAASQMRSLEPGYYAFSLVIADGPKDDANTNAAQVFAGSLPVVWGGVS